MAKHFREAMASITMLMTLRGGYAKLREDLANSYAAGMDTYFSKPSDMRDYLVNWRNSASRPSRFSGNALTFTQAEDTEHHHELHATFGTRPRGRCWDCDSPDHYRGDKECSGKRRGTSNAHTTRNNGELHVTLGNTAGDLNSMTSTRSPKDSLLTWRPRSWRNHPRMQK